MDDLSMRIRPDGFLGMVLQQYDYVYISELVVRGRHSLTVRQVLSALVVEVHSKHFLLTRYIYI